jgi:predicted anti-sigma-YlaC factor YlaD
MDCKKLELLSALIDGELEACEGEKYRNHLLTCPVCLQARDEFLGLGEQIRVIEAGPELFARSAVLEEILSTAEPTGFWRRRMAVPLPVMGLLCLSLLIFATALLSGSREPQAIPVGVTFPSGPRDQDPVDIARLDKGGRAVLIKIPRPASVDLNPGEIQ